MASSQSWTPPPVGYPTWLELPSLDLSRATTFYTSVFGWTANGDPSTMQFFSFPAVKGGAAPFTGGHISLIEKAAAPKEAVAPTSLPTLYLWCDDVEEMLAKVLEAGGSVATPKMPFSNVGYYARFADTEGNVLGIYEIKKGAE